MLLGAAACGRDEGLEIERDVVVLRPGPFPAATFVADRTDVSDGTLAGLVRERSLGVEVSRCLERAAEQYARLIPAEALRLPLAASEFILHWAGCPDPTAAVLVVQTTEPGPEPLLEQLTRVLGAADFTHIGAAAAPGNGELAHRWTVFLSQRRFELRPVARAGRAGGRLPLTFRLDPGLHEPRVFSTLPGRGVQEIAAAEGGGWAVATVPLSPTPGQQWVEVVADGAHGPEVVALFPIAVGEDPERVWRGRLLPDESGIRFPQQAEALIESLVNEDRGRFGLPPLELDPRLRDVARSHSREMAREDYFGHDSPESGGMVDRLTRSGYPIRFGGENVARSTSLADAHESLMRSPGHRANILSADATHFGVGVARDESADGGSEWVVTQEFARPLEPAPVAVIEQRVRTLLAGARRATGARELVEDGALDEAARVAAEAIAQGLSTGELTGVVGRELARAGTRYRELQVYTGEAYGPEDIQAPAPDVVATAIGSGVGLARVGTGGVAPTTYVVLLLQ